jgi:very-short-patch-repair endonuclease
MINWAKTKEIFGISDLNNLKCKQKVIVNCDLCGKERPFEIRNKSRVINNDISWKCPKCIGNSKETSEKLSRSTSRQWSNNDYRLKMKSMMDEFWKDENFINNHKKSTNTEEVKRINSENAKKAWAINDYRDGHVLTLKEKWKNPEFRQNISNKTRIWVNSNKKIKETLSDQAKERWKADLYRNKMAVVRSNMQSSGTKIELTLYSLLNDMGIKYERQHKIGYYLFDCFLPDHKILIECNGDYWHSLPKAVRNDKSKSTYISTYFPEYKLYSIWEHEFKCVDKIRNLISYWTGNKTDVFDFDFKNVKIEESTNDEYKLFLSKYHYLGTAGNNLIRIIARFDNKIVGVCIFGQISRKESADRLGLKPKELLELTRFCIHPQYQKKNFASWFIGKSIKYVKDLNKYKCLISFADETHNHSGVIYKASNWILDGKTNPDYWYQDGDGYVMHKKTLYNHAISIKMKESEFAEKYGYIKIWGKEKYRYLYWLTKENSTK